MDGGLSKGELAIILAPFGVGKTTMITKVANSAKNAGHNVLQLFFEDNPKVIQRKHLTCWTEGKFTLNELSDNKMKILKNLSMEVISLQKLSKKVNMSISLLSYHINGNYKYKGLKEFRLIEVEEKQKQLYVKLSQMGDLLLKGYIGK